MGQLIISTDPGHHPKIGSIRYMTKSMRQTMSRRQKPESGEAEQEYKADTTWV